MSISDNLLRNVRAVAIFGPGASAEDLKPFQKNLEANWLTDLPDNPSQADAVLIFGGDGTIHRYLPQLVGLQIPLLVVPCGSGNDFARALGLKNVRDSLAAWRKFSSGNGNERTIDLGVIAATKTGSDTGESHYFCCMGGVGLDAEVSRRANQLPRWVRARGGYILSLLPALLGFTPISMRLSLPEHRDDFVSRKTIMIAAFANAPSYGGGMKIAPHAQLDDGLLDVCIIGHMNKLKLLCLFPTVYLGRHLSIPQVEYFQTERFKLETEAPQDIYADGEYVCRTPIEVSLARNARQVIVP
jgi:diacylglycerol kinase (ATP)